MTRGLHTHVRVHVQERSIKPDVSLRCLSNAHYATDDDRLRCVASVIPTARGNVGPDRSKGQGIQRWLFDLKHDTQDGDSRA